VGREEEVGVVEWAGVIKTKNDGLRGRGDWLEKSVEREGDGRGAKTI
jgi:hypothetical protein